MITAPQHPPVYSKTRPHWVLTGAFGLAGFLAAFLLFTIEPLAAKSLLPTLGGSAAVWNTAMAFFQLVLLLGYLAAHVTDTWVPSRFGYGSNWRPWWAPVFFCRSLSYRLLPMVPRLLGSYRR